MRFKAKDELLEGVLSITGQISHLIHPSFHSFADLIFCFCILQEGFHAVQVIQEFINSQPNSAQASSFTREANFSSTISTTIIAMFTGLWLRWSSFLPCFPTGVLCYIFLSVSFLVKWLLRHLWPFLANQSIKEKWSQKITAISELHFIIQTN